MASGQCHQPIPTALLVFVCVGRGEARKFQQPSSMQQ